MGSEISQPERQIMYDVTYLGNVLIPHTSSVKLKIFQASFCFFAFIFHGDGPDPCLPYHVTNLHP